MKIGKRQMSVDVIGSKMSCHYDKLARGLVIYPNELQTI